MNNILLNVLLVIVPLVCGGCATYNAATGHNEMIFVSTSSEVSMGNQIHRELSRKHKIIENTPEALRLERIGQRVARVSDRQDFKYQFHLVESGEINAFTVPGGHIYFYTGLFCQLPSDDEVAAVLAHEIGHCAAKHTIKKFQSALGFNVARSVVLNVLSIKLPGIQHIASLGANGIMGLAMSAYGRADEHEADRLGIKYLHLARFDLNAMIRVFDVLQKQDKGRGAPLFLRTHPFVKDRVMAVKKDIEQVKVKY